MKKSLVLLLPVSIAFLAGCGSDSATVPKVSEQLSSAATFLSNALPKFGNSVGARESASDRSINFITPAVWSSTSAGDKTNPPGGVVSDASGEPQYGGATMPTLVNYRDFMKMSLDPDFKRKGDDGTNRPTVFGRFDSMVKIIGYMNEAGITVDASGMPAVGSYNVPLTLDGNSFRIVAVIASTSVSTYYDRTIDMYAFVDSNGNQVLDDGETLAFRNLMWMRSNTSSLNFMMVELGDRNSDTTPDTVGVNVIRWNISTGNFQFEYISNPDDAISNGNMEIFRAQVAATGDQAYLYGFTGKANPAHGGGDFLQYALYSPTTSSAEGTVSLREVRPDTNVWLGNVCSTFTTGVASAGDTAGEAEPASGGTCAGQAAASINTKAGIMGFANTVRGYTTWIASADAKGFPATANANWSSESARAAWLSAGQSVSVSFSDRTGFISDWDATP